jgi:hypothetical protein
MRYYGKLPKAGGVTDDNMTHAHCMLVTKGYKHTRRVCNTYCFSTATVIARKLLSVFIRAMSVFNVIVLSPVRPPPIQTEQVLNSWEMIHRTEGFQ